MNIKKIAKIGGYVLPILIGLLEAASFGLDFVNDDENEEQINYLIEEKLKERGL